MAPRTVLLIGALSLTAGWLLGNATSWLPGEARRSTPSSSGPRALGMAPDRASARQSSERRSAGRPAGDAPLTRQLRQRLDTQPPSTPVAGRNPFTFGAPRPAAVSRDREAPPAAAPPPPMPLPAPVPRFKLSGIASSVIDGTTVWTAIINDNGSLAFVKTGEALSNGHRVVSIEETGVVIVDAAGITQTLRLP